MKIRLHLPHQSQTARDIIWAASPDLFVVIGSAIPPHNIGAFARNYISLVVEGCRK